MARKSSKQIASTVATPDSPPEDLPPGSPPSHAASAITQRFEIYGASSLADLALLKGLGFTQVIVDHLDLAVPADAMGLSVVWRTSGTGNRPGATSTRRSSSRGNSTAWSRST
jgi:hypothetical protein